jgi:hypothetical protein
VDGRQRGRQAGREQQLQTVKGVQKLDKKNRRGGHLDHGNRQVPGERGHTPYGRFQRYFEAFLKRAGRKKKKKKVKKV